MNILTSTAAKLRRIQESMPYLVRLVVNENATLLEDMNIAQLEEGKRADGVTLRDYSPRSVLEFGKPPGPIKLFETGAFRRKIVVQAIGNVIDVSNTDPKYLMLADEFGKDIVGISYENQGVFVRIILQPELLKKVNERLFPLR
jgi:hypothetical protein